MTDADLPELHVVDLQLDPNEASGLLAVRAPGLLEARGWREGYWTALDEGRVEDSLALIGRRADRTGPNEGWEVAQVRGRVVGEVPATVDAEALAYRDGWVYVIGSHFGGKQGPLQPERSFLARFREEAHLRGDEVELAVVADQFRLHRQVNDALRAQGLDLVPVDPQVRREFLEPVADPRVRADDWPINVEGAGFLDDGSLLLGLRFPVTADGHPLLVQLTGAEAPFEGRPEGRAVVAVWVLGDVGSRERFLGVRDLDVAADGLHLVAGNLDATGVDSLVLASYPRGREAPSAHWRCRLPSDRSGGHLPATLVREFPGLERIEGLAANPDGTHVYVQDESSKVLTRFATA